VNFASGTGRLRAEGGGVASETGAIYGFAEAAAAIPWVTAKLYRPAHEYVIYAKCPVVAWEVVSTAIARHPDSYLAFFRGYLRPNRYFEHDGRRYWRTSTGRVHMLNRSRLEDSEPPRRVDEGAVAIDWAANPSFEYGGGWPEWQVLGEDGWYRDRKTGRIAGRDNEVTWLREHGGRRPKS
jgi:hypothetical protein